MPVNLRRLFGVGEPTSPQSAPEIALQRTVARLVAAERARTLPTDADLDLLSEVTPSDITRAESLWDAAQRKAGTGLDGLLAARLSDA